MDFVKKTGGSAGIRARRKGYTALDPDLTVEADGRQARDNSTAADTTERC